MLADTAGRQLLKKKSPSSGENYAEDHSELFLKHGLTWPVTQAMKQAVGSGAVESKVTRRPLESMIFCASAYPHPGKGAANVTTEGLQFLDLNVSLLRLVGKEGNRNPWRPFVPTMTCMSIILVRSIEQESDNPPKAVYSLLDGADMMQLTGYPLDQIKPDWSFYPSMMLAKAAGNAFSGFTFQSLITAFVSALGKASSMPPPGPLDEKMQLVPEEVYTQQYGDYKTNGLGHTKGSAQGITGIIMPLPNEAPLLSSDDSGLSDSELATLRS